MTDNLTDAATEAVLKAFNTCTHDEHGDPYRAFESRPEGELARMAAEAVLSVSVIRHQLALAQAVMDAEVEQRGSRRGTVVKRQWGSQWCESHDSLLDALRAVGAATDTPKAGE